MTYNATSIHIAKALKAGLIVERSTLRQAEHPPSRHFYATQDLAKLLDGAVIKPGFSERQADALIGSYIAGHFVNVSLGQKGTARPEIQRLVEIDEVWAFCVRKPRPGWRILGRFMLQDHFVGLKAFDRNGQDYKSAADEAIRIWDKLFNGVAPLTGSAIGDYFSGKEYWIVGEKY